MAGILAISALLFAQGAKKQTAKEPDGASKSLLPLPPPPPPPSGKEMPPPPPPPPAVKIAYPVHYEFFLTNPWIGGLYRDLSILPGRVESLNWVATGAGNTNVTGDIDFTIQTPYAILKAGPNGATSIVVPQGGANVRILATRTAHPGPFQLRVAFDLAAPK